MGKFLNRQSIQKTAPIGKNCRYSIPYSTDLIEKAKADVVKSMGFQDGYVRPIAWRGTETMGVSAQNNTIHLAITVRWPSYLIQRRRQKV